jgi:hypothetical protein
MMLLLFLDDIKSERELMRIIPEGLDYLWFLGPCLEHCDQGSNHPTHRPGGAGVERFSYRSLAEWYTSAWRGG